VPEKHGSILEYFLAFVVKPEMPCIRKTREYFRCMPRKSSHLVDKAKNSVVRKNAGVLHKFAGVLPKYREMAWFLLVL